MVTATFDITTGTIALYLDGTSLPVTTNNAGTLTSIYNQNLAFTLGWGNQAGSQYLDGLQDETSIFTYVLSSTQVTTLYNSGTPLPWDSFIPTASTTIYFSYDNLLSMNGVTGQTCSTEGATTTCSFEFSTSTTPIWVNSQDIVISLVVIIFLLAFLWFGYIFSPFKKS